MERLSGHSALAMGDKMVVYGGKTSANTLSGEVLALDIDTCVWNRVITTGMVPRARAFHTAIAYEGSMIVFGGLLAVGVDDIHYNMFNMVANADALPIQLRDLPGTERFKLPQTLSPTTQRKLEPTSLHCLSLHRQATWSSLSAIGAVPPTRCYHSATLYDSCMLITGGYSVHTTAQPKDEELQAVYSTYSLDLRAMVWREIISPFSVPKRWGCSSILSGSYWILYGGIDIITCSESSAISVFNITKGEWKVLDVGDRAPSVQPRAMHTAVRWGDRFVMFGGSFDLGAEPTNQLCQFDLLSGALSLIPRLSDALPCPRYGHSAVVVGTDMVVFGGTSAAGSLLEDVWAMSLTTGVWREWKAQWSDTLTDNVYGRPVGSLVTPKNASPKRATMATQSESTPSEVVEALRAHSALEERRRRREHEISMKTVIAQRRVQAVDEGDFSQDAPVESFARKEVKMRTLKMHDLNTLSSPSEQQVVSHWQAELQALQHENARWQSVTEQEASGVANEYFSRHDYMLSPRARKAILNCQTPTALTPKQHLYVSPSLAKLGIREAPYRQY